MPISHIVVVVLQILNFEFDFFNFLVPAAGRDNVRQSALDFVSLLKVAQTFDFEIDRARRGGNNDPGDEAPAIDTAGDGRGRPDLV